MKKTLTIAVVLAFGAMAAVAGTINVPQFNDGGADVNAAFFPPAGNATFITLTNGTDTAKTLTINAYTLAGALTTSTTYAMAAHKAVSWRPAATDTAEADSVAAAGTNAGSLQILFDGVASDVSGRVFVNAAASGTSFAFTIIPY